MVLCVYKIIWINIFIMAVLKFVCIMSQHKTVSFIIDFALSTKGIINFRALNHYNSIFSKDVLEKGNLTK